MAPAKIISLRGTTRSYRALIRAEFLLGIADCSPYTQKMGTLAHVPHNGKENGGRNNLLTRIARTIQRRVFYESTWPIICEFNFWDCGCHALLRNLSIAGSPLLTMKFLAWKHNSCLRALPTWILSSQYCRGICDTPTAQSHTKFFLWWETSLYS